MVLLRGGGFSRRWGIVDGFTPLEVFCKAGIENLENHWNCFMKGILRTNTSCFLKLRHFATRWMDLPHAATMVFCLGIHLRAMQLTNYGPELTFKVVSFCRVVVAHTCNTSTLGGRDRWISEFEASLIYRVSARTARATQRKPVSKKQKQKNKCK